MGSLDLQNGSRQGLSLRSLRLEIITDPEPVFPFKLFRIVVGGWRRGHVSFNNPIDLEWRSATGDLNIVIRCETHTCTHVHTWSSVALEGTRISRSFTFLASFLAVVVKVAQCGSAHGPRGNSSIILTLLA